MILDQYGKPAITSRLGFVPSSPKAPKPEDGEDLVSAIGFTIWTDDEAEIQ